jgi:hypothetical protein
MYTLINNSIRLLFGALLVSSSFLYSQQVSQTTFLFCLEPKDNPLEITRSNSSYEVNNSSLNKALHDIGVVNIESWISGATNVDRHGDIFLNRIYRASVGRENNPPAYQH